MVCKQAKQAVTVNQARENSQWFGGARLEHILEEPCSRDPKIRKQAIFSSVHCFRSVGIWEGKEDSLEKRLGQKEILGKPVQNKYVVVL